MERLTSNKQTSDMNMLELAYNSCYTDINRKARYRDYELDIDSRELTKRLVKDMCDEDLSDMSDEEFDEYMAEMLSVEMDSQIGLLALFYRNLWAMADLRERLKDYEDLEEQGRLLKLPCTIGDTAYVIVGKNISVQKIQRATIDSERKVEFCTKRRGFTLFDINKSVFLTKSEAEAKLKELRGGEE